MGEKHARGGIPIVTAIIIIIFIEIYRGYWIDRCSITLILIMDQSSKIVKFIVRMKYR